MKIIIGLGNPGEKYNHTRHNAGFMLVEKLRTSWNFPEFKLNAKFDAEISEGTTDCHSGIFRLDPLRLSEARKYPESTLSNTEKVLLAKPNTFMNLSGTAVRKILDFYKLSPGDIVVIHDDLDLELGKYKISTNSSSAGHHGVEDLIEKLGTQQFKRIRIGISKPPEEKLACQISGADFVLQKFTSEDLSILEKVIGDIIITELE